MSRLFNFSRLAAEKTILFIYRDTPLYLVIFIYTVFTILLLYFSNSLEMSAYELYYYQWTKMFLFFMPVVALLLDALYIIHRFDNRRRLAFKRIYSPNRIAYLLSGMMLLMGLMFFQGSFTSLKNVFPLLHNGFPYDQVQADIDAWLHLGVDPWRFVHRIAEVESLLSILELNYNVMWFIICFGVLFYVSTSPAAQAIRTRYIIMFMLTWTVCGNVLAGLFLSAGPAFYGAVTGDNGRFGDLTAFLAINSNAFSSASDFQAYLWSLYESQRPGLGSGISAFPSIHVALITLNALFLFDVSRKFGSLALAYTGLILASSVYLGWHYAIDGYVSIVVVIVLHKLCKYIIKDYVTTSTSEHRDQVTPVPELAN